ncbi:hypothetical protein [Actinoplanes sp. TFC3]|uniref:hypothetical protein n=1 Tax=Actinoplanes sp. TFC3 TaxID=1710355 RepID=UPI00156EAB72|nr:hypothetical protein [Actinoplanes sp. TFC3]
MDSITRTPSQTRATPGKAVAGVGKNLLRRTSTGIRSVISGHCVAVALITGMSLTASRWLRSVALDTAPVRTALAGGTLACAGGLVAGELNHLVLGVTRLAVLAPHVNVRF